MTENTSKSNATVKTTEELAVIPINAFDDNYLWLIREPNSSKCCIVDPGDADVVLDYIQKNALTLSAILITHHHGDHTGGITRLLEFFDVPVYGPKSNNIPTITHPLHDGDSITLFGQTFNILEIPGHTLDHIAYYTNHGSPLLFCGDTLFAGGCGRVFEGTYTMMYNSLQKLTTLNANTKVYCAHEYTLANLAFAKAVSPQDEILSKRIEQEKTKRENNIPTVPTTLALELKTNPFLLCSDSSIQHSIEQKFNIKTQNDADVFAHLRQWKDSF